MSRPETAFDQEAYARATSVYFPDRAIPMLPEALSNGICSLNPNEDRLTKTACIEFNAKGEVIRSRFFNSVIRSHERMTYTDVRRILVDKDPQCLERYRNLIGEFKLMEELALLIYASRKARGNLDFDLPEAEIILDLQGVPENIVRAERNIAHRIIEEFMIAANEAVARHLTDKDFPTLYRVHEGPDRRRARSIGAVSLEPGLSLAAEEREHRAAGNSKTSGIRARQTGRARDQSRALALDETGGLSAGKHRPLRLGIDVLHPFHFADPPLSRSDRAPHARPSHARR